MKVAASPQKKEVNPASLRSAALPREGARVDAPSFLWKEVPRRGGGWMGIPLSPYRQSEYRIYVEKTIPMDKAFPAWGRWGAERAG